MKRLRVHIDRLTLEDKSRAEAGLIVTAMERHLSALANGTPMANERGPVPHAAGADALGRRIAAQVFHKMGGARHV